MAGADRQAIILHTCRIGSLVVAADLPNTKKHFALLSMLHCEMERSGRVSGRRVLP
jgi:hypothetical protein